jgi:predicted O-methyltransferase YrrM
MQMSHQDTLNKRLKMLNFWHKTRRVTEFFGSRYAQETLYQGIFERGLSALGVQHAPFYAVKSGANYSLLYTLLRIVTETPCSSILELGAGQSSILLDALKQVKPDLSVTSIETDETWARATGARVAHEVIYSPLTRRNIRGVDVAAYSDLSALGDRKFDVVLVDGPPGAAKHHSRWAALEILAGHLAPEFAVVFDDAERGGEQETVREFAKMHHWNLDNGMTLGTKGQIMLYTPSFVAAKYF